MLVLFLALLASSATRARIAKAAASVWIRLPVIGNIILKTSLARYLRSLSLLLGNGAPMAQAIVCLFLRGPCKRRRYLYEGFPLASCAAVVGHKRDRDFLAHHVLWFYVVPLGANRDLGFVHTVDDLVTPKPLGQKCVFAFGRVNLQRSVGFGEAKR